MVTRVLERCDRCSERVAFTLPLTEMHGTRVHHEELCTWCWEEEHGQTVTDVTL